MDAIAAKLKSEPPKLGISVPIPDGEVEYYNGASHDVAFVAQQHILAINLKPDETLVAFNSDKLQPLATPENCIVVMPAGTEIQEIRRTTDGMADCLFVALEPGRLERRMAELNDGRMFELELRSNLIHPALGFMGTELRACIVEQPIDSNLLLDTLVTSLEAQLLATLDPLKRGAVKKVPPLAKQRLTNVMDYMRAHLDQDIGLDDFARAAEMSTFFFIKSFRSATGMTPWQYLIRQRVTRARELLLDTRLTLAEVAHACGFSSQSHLTTVFRKTLGLTPARYRSAFGSMPAVRTCQNSFGGP